jgi:hypothetical protein
LGIEFYNFAESVDVVPASTVIEYPRNIAYLLSQSSIYTLNKIAQEEAQIVDKQMPFYPDF